MRQVKVDEVGLTIIRIDIVLLRFSTFAQTTDRKIVQNLVQISVECFVLRTFQSYPKWSKDLYQFRTAFGRWTFCVCCLIVILLVISFAWTEIYQQRYMFCHTRHPFRYKNKNWCIKSILHFNFTNYIWYVARSSIIYFCKEISAVQRFKLKCLCWKSTNLWLQM